jgi:hypothetical protein
MPPGLLERRVPSLRRASFLVTGHALGNREPHLGSTAVVGHGPPLESDGEARVKAVDAALNPLELFIAGHEASHIRDALLGTFLR